MLINKVHVFHIYEQNRIETFCESLSYGKYEDSYNIFTKKNAERVINNFRIF
jgi:hypothetical protein